MWPPGVVTIRVPQDPHFFNLHGSVECYPFIIWRQQRSKHWAKPDTLSLITAT
jgi:hypothetical protein